MLAALARLGNVSTISSINGPAMEKTIEILSELATRVRPTSGVAQAPTCSDLPSHLYI